jgi:hypothetical protein
MINEGTSTFTLNNKCQILQNIPKTQFSDISDDFLRFYGLRIALYPIETIFS